MKVFTSISMSFIFLLQGMASDMDLCEPIDNTFNFITQYHDHKDFDGNSFFEYIAEEYFGDDHHGEEQPRDSSEKQSPAHSDHQCCHPLVFITPTNTVVLNLLKFEEKKQVNSNTSQLNSRFMESLFQPPRV